MEANTLAVLAYRYTSITSVAMLDAFSIPGTYGLLLGYIVRFCVGMGITAMHRRPGTLKESSNNQQQVVCLWGRVDQLGGCCRVQAIRPRSRILPSVLWISPIFWLGPMVQVSRYFAAALL